MAAAGMMARLLHDAFGDAVADWQQILIFLSFASVFLGSIAAIGQTDIKRLLAERPTNIRGLAVPGMIVGSPGMEQPDGHVERYDVVAFDADNKTSVYASY